MKNSRECPKCESSDIIRVPGERGGDLIVVGSLGLFTSIPITRFVCGQCGFTEEWIDTAEHLERVKQRYGTTQTGA